MTQVVRYFHIRPFHQQKGGHTVKVTGDTDVVGQVYVQVAKCSRKDPYVKRVGREEAEKAPIKIVPLRYLGRELDRIAGHSDFSAHDFAIKYFLPKE